MSIKASETKASLAIKVDGTHIPLDKLRRLLDSFMETLNEIDKETSNDNGLTVFWDICSLTYNSPLLLEVEATPNAESVSLERPINVINTFRDGMRALQQSQSYPNGFSEKALKSARKITEVINPNDVAEITFIGNGWQTQINANLITNLEKHLTDTYDTYKSYGSVEGKLISISLVNRKKFGVKTNLQSSTVDCYFKEDDLFEKARKYLGERVYVYGVVRKKDNGEKINITVQEIERLPNAEDIPSPQELLTQLWSMA